MPNQASIKGDVDFLRKLYEELMLADKFQLERDPYGSYIDLLVRNPTSGKAVAVEMKDAGGYGELPISTIIPISKLVRQHGKYEKVLLLTFSNVPILLSRKLEELNVEAMTQPTIKQVVDKIQMALSA